jgi:hypothetical protein
MKGDRSVARRGLLALPHLVLFVFFVWLFFGGEHLPAAVAVPVVAAGLHVVGESAWRFWREHGETEKL